MYDPLQIFLHETGSQEFGVLVCGSVFSGADLSYFAAFNLLELPLTAADLSRKQFHLYHRGSSLMHQCHFPDHHLGLIDERCDTVLPNRACYLFPLHSPKMNASNPGRMMKIGVVII